MKLADTSYDNSETDCCACFDPAAWADEEVVWENVPFVKERVRSFAHIPLTFGRAITRANDAIEAAAAYPHDPFTLTRHVSPWRSDLYVSVQREIDGVQIESLSGTFLVRVFEGPYRLAGQWEAEMRTLAEERGRTVDDVLFYYTVCPKCAKHFGKNYVVVLAQLASE